MVQRLGQGNPALRHPTVVLRQELSIQRLSPTDRPVGDVRPRVLSNASTGLGPRSGRARGYNPLSRPWTSRSIPPFSATPSCSKTSRTRSLRAVLAQGQLLEFGPGQVIFRQGDQGDRLFVVKSGVLEVVAHADGRLRADVPVAYLGTGRGARASSRCSPARRAPPPCARRSRPSVFIGREGGVPRPDGRAAGVLAQPVRGAREAARGHDAQGAARLGQAAPGQPEVLRPRDGDPDADRLAPDGRCWWSQAASKHKLAEIFFFKGNIARAKVRHLSGDDAVFQLFQAPLEGEFSFTGRTVRGGRGPERHHDARDLAADGVGAAAGRAAAAAGAAAGPRARLPPEGGAARVGRGGDRRAGGGGLVAAQEGRDPDGPAARRARARRYAIYRTVVALLDAGQIE